MIAMKRTVVIFLTFNDEQNEMKKKMCFVLQFLNHFVSDKFCCEIYILEEIDHEYRFAMF